MDTRFAPNALSRRHLLRLIGGAVLTAPLLQAACDNGDGGGGLSGGDADALDSLETSTDTGVEAGADTSAETPDTAVDSTSAETTADTGPEDTGAATGWATGGTAAMTAMASYPDPFAAGLGSTCALTCAATIGPCHTTSPERQDVSDGWDGLPVRLSFMVVDEDCQPIEDVIVEIWHTNHEGTYSGDIVAMCNDVEAYRAQGFFRGYQRSDANGRVDFDTCYPGWYRGRVVHFHVRVMSGAYNASDNAASEVISQFFFSDELNASIFANEPKYASYGQPDTQLSNDNVVGGESDPSPYVLDVQRLSDGAMLASKAIILSTTSSCNMGGGGAGGQPPR